MSFATKENIKNSYKNNKIILKTKHIFRSEEHNVFTEEINKTALGSNDDKRMQTIDLMRTYAYGMNKNIVYKKQKSKCNNIINPYKNA